MHLYLTQEGLESIAANYRQQAEEAESLTGIRRAEGAAMAIEHLLKECYLSDVPIEAQAEVEQEA